MIKYQNTVPTFEPEFQKQYTKQMLIICYRLNQHGKYINVYILFQLATVVWWISFTSLFTNVNHRGKKIQIIGNFISTTLVEDGPALNKWVIESYLVYGFLCKKQLLIRFLFIM